MKSVTEIPMREWVYLFMPEDIDECLPNIFENNFGCKQKFAKYVKESSGLGSDTLSSLQMVITLYKGIAIKTFAKRSGCFWVLQA